MSKEKRPHFPLFISLEKEKVLVVGGGIISERRVKTLLNFGASITLISPTVTVGLKELISTYSLDYQARSYEKGDTKGARLVLAATNNPLVNTEIGKEARRGNIPVSVADAMEESSFYFPAIVMGQGVVAGLVSRQGKDHKQVKKVSEALRQQWEANNEDK